MKFVLAHHKPIAQGLNRCVYAHPHDPGQLIKVLRPDRAQWYDEKRFRWYQRRRRYRGCSGFLQEIREHLAVYAAERGISPHLENIVGMTDTDLGFGLIVEALRGRNGGYAPPLSKVVRSGDFDASAQAALDQFLAWLLQSPIVVTDLTWGNLLYAVGDNHTQRFVLIDGFGESVALPLRTFSDSINRRSKIKRIEQLHSKIDQAFCANGVSGQGA
ncbi:YrbL family protein [Algiphilus sp. W345]|uniref:YrbL family protein n=1 Tax=Banduia mediterranea TaxID=3075609 RepID=A0ABU2WMZ9_9GAMM|nr:YrbL family protein [Algiphilus sp. W345]MDT0498462.1 YrbL family protein [Algiphilus sp. W345]